MDILTFTFSVQAKFIVNVYLRSIDHFDPLNQCCGSDPICTGSGSANPVWKKPDPDPVSQKPDPVDPKRPDPDPQHWFKCTYRDVVGWWLGSRTHRSGFHRTRSIAPLSCWQHIIRLSSISSRQPTFACPQKVCAFPLRFCVLSFLATCIIKNSMRGRN